MPSGRQAKGQGLLAPLPEARILGHPCHNRRKAGKCRLAPTEALFYLSLRSLPFLATRLHRERGRRKGRKKKERVLLLHAPTEGPRTARLNHMGERAQVWARLLVD